MRNPYTVLGLNKQAKPEEIKSAFRKLAKQYHPDHNRDDPSAQERFAEINQAYEILGDKDKRRQFDRGEINAEGKQSFGAGMGGGGAHPFADFAAHFAQGGATRGGGQGFRGTHFDADDLFFRDLFNRDSTSTGGFGKGRSAAGASRRGSDIATTLAITLEQAIGAENVEVIFSNGKRLKIKLPNFVEEGQTIRLKGQGEMGNGGGGDALVTIGFKPHPRFRLEGRDLHLDLPVSLKGAVLGTREEVETLDGRVVIAIPAWSSSDRILRLRGKGLPEKNGGRADLYVHVRIMLPETHDSDLEHYLKTRY